MRLIMLPAPTVDTFETRMECRANKLTLTRGREQITWHCALPSPGQIACCFKRIYEMVTC